MTLKGLRKNSIAIGLGLTCVLLGGLSVALTKSGSRILNKAVATYEYNTQVYNVESNEVSTIVLPVFGVSITPNGTTGTPGQSQQAVPATRLYFPYLLTNTGNIPDSYDLTTVIDAGSTFTPLAISIHRDVNGNGTVDASETAVTNSGLLEADETIPLIVAFDAPASTLTGQFALVNITGTSTGNNGQVDNDNWCRTDIVGDATLKIMKSVSQLLADPGDTLVYLISGKNTGTAPTRARTFNSIDTNGDGTVDAGQTGQLIKDTIPTYTSVTGVPATDFSSVAPSGSLSLYGYNNGNWSTNGNVSGWGGLAAVTKVGLFISNTIDGGKDFKLEWRAQVSASSPGIVITNQATVDWENSGGSIDDTPSNTTLTQVHTISNVVIGPKGDPAGTGTGSYQTPDPTTGPSTIIYDTDISNAAFARCSANHSQLIEFTNTIQNQGNSPDTLNVSATWTNLQIASATIRLFKSDGLTPLNDSDGDGIDDTGTVAAGASYNIVMKLYLPENVPCDTASHDVTLTVLSGNQSGIQDTTVNRIQFGPEFWDPLTKEVLPTGDVTPGLHLRFTNTFGNAGGMAATDVVITDVLQSDLINPRNIIGLPATTIPDQSGTNTPIAVSAVYVAGLPAGSGGTISWTFPSIPAGFTGQVSFDVTVDPNTADGSQINNTISMTGTGLPVATSNVTANYVVTENLLAVEKQVNKESAEIGEHLKYTIVTTNRSVSMEISQPVQITDTLPRGLRYQAGSSRLDGQDIADPDISDDGKTLIWQNIGSLAADSNATLTFVALVVPGAEQGDATNRVRVMGHSISGTPMYSNEATATVKIKKGVFDDCRTLMGKVFIDENDNRTQDKGEIGIPGIRLVLENGMFTLTDSEGKYHFDCLAPVTHVLTLDKTSLPAGMEAKIINSRNMGDPYSQFVDVTPLGLWKANFRLKPLSFKKDTRVEELAEQTELQARLKDFLKKIELGELKPVLFDTAKSSLRPISFETLNYLGSILQEYPALKIRIEGHTDWRGSDSYNLNLSQSRVDSVRDYLVSMLEIPSENLIPIGYGESRPIASNKTREGMQKNRRVEYHVVLPQDKASISTTKKPEGAGARKEITVHLPRAIGGPLKEVYLVVGPQPLSIKKGTVKIDGAKTSHPIPFGEFWWVRLNNVEQEFDVKDFDLNRQKILAEGFSDTVTARIRYMIPNQPGEPYHFVAARNKTGQITIFIEDIRQTDKKAYIHKKKIAALYEQMHPDTTVVQQTVKPITKAVPKTYGILSPDDKATYMDRNKITVKVCLPTGWQETLIVNGRLVPKQKIGKKVFNKTTGRTTLIYRNVPITAGKNQIEFVSTDDKEGIRKDALTVLLGSTPTKIKMKTQPHQLPADGKTEPVVVIEPVDDQGIALPDGAWVTLAMDKGRFVTPDANPKQFGYQAIVRSGKAEVVVSSAHKPESRILAARVGELKQQVQLDYVPYLRDWIIVGYGEGTVGYNQLSSNEQGENHGDPEGLFVDGRLAYFVKGTVLGSVLLTSAYDTGKEDDMDTIYQMIEPDKLYPVYGDASIARYDAPTRRKFYIKLARDNSYILYGDYRTAMQETETARYDRTFTGVFGNFQSTYLDAIGFGSETDQTLVKDEIRGKGISGYYMLSHNDIVVNSDKIKIETRDRHNASRIIESRELSRFTDYWINYEQGTLLFKEPQKSVDETFNPVYIVVGYETREGAEKHWNYGGRIKAKLLDDHIQIGATGIIEEQAAYKDKLFGVDIKGKIGTGIELGAEVSQSDIFDPVELDTKKGLSKAGFLKIDFANALKLRVNYLDTDEAFRNPNMSSFNGAIRDINLQGLSEIIDNWAFKIDGSYRQNQLTSDLRQAGGVLVEYQIIKQLRVLFGGRYVDLSTSAVEQEAILAKAGLVFHPFAKLKTWMIHEQVVSGSKLDQEGFASMSSSFATFTNKGTNAQTVVPAYMDNGTPIVGDGYPDKTIVGAEYQLADNTRIRAGQEWLSGQSIKLNRSLLGISSQLTNGLSVFGNYGIEDSIDNPRNVANIGLNNKLQLQEDLSVNIGVERLETLIGEKQDDFTALTTGFSYLPKFVKLTGRYELRLGKTDNKHLGEFGVSKKMNTFFSLFGRERLYYTDHFQQNDEYRNELLIGAAYRPRLHDYLNVVDSLKLINEKVASGDEEVKLINSLEGHMQFSADVLLSAKYALKWQQDSFDGTAFAAFTDLLGLRFVVDLTSIWDLGFYGGLLHQYDSSIYDYYVGAETGIRVIKNLWLSAGYNFKALEDQDFGLNNYWVQGPYIALRFKFGKPKWGENIGLFKKGRQ